MFVRRDRCLGCRTCELACALWRDSAGRRLAAAEGQSPLPRARVRVMIAGQEGRPFPNQCRQCEDAPCVAVCPTGALHLSQPAPVRGWARDPAAAGRREVIAFRPELCIGCFSCLHHCPFGAIVPDGAGRYPLRCDACAGMEYPGCVDSCPAGALVVADADELDPADLWEPLGRAGGGRQ